MYSVAAAPETAPGKPCVAFSVVRHVTPSGAERRGVATNWLDRTPGAHGTFLAPIFDKRSAAFRPPEDISAPVLMIGPGTGVAPFRGFLQRRRARIAEGGVAPGPSLVVFPAVRREEDYLYREDLESLNRGTSPNSRLAFSRETEEARAATHRGTREDVGALIAASNARVFVCGDGAGMAKDVTRLSAAALAGVDGRGEAGDGDARGDDQEEGTCATSGREGGEREGLRGGSTRRFIIQSIEGPIATQHESSTGHE